MEEVISRSRKRKVSITAGLFTGLLLLLTFAGNTLQALTLPKVVITSVNKGSLVHSYVGRSTINPKEERELIHPSGWKVDKVLVKKGEMVRKGQVLIQYDGSEVKQQIAVEQSALKKLNLSMELLEYNVIQAMQEEDESLLISATSAFETAKLDIAAQQQQIENLKHTLSVNQQMVAPFDGIVIEIGAMEGLSSTGKPDITMSHLAKGYGLEMYVPSGIAATLSVGDVLDNIMLEGKEEPSITGEIDRIEEDMNSLSPDVDEDAEKSSSSMTRLFVKLKGSGLSGGEQVRISIVKTKSSEGILIPNKAVHKDSEGAYVYTIKETQGPLGNAYYAVRTSIQITDSNSHTTSVVGGLFDQQEIIVDSSDLIMDGARVNVYNQN